jgi:archaellum component FlaC
MNEGATRKDIDEVVDILKDFMTQVSQQFEEVNKRLDNLEQKHDHLVSTITRKFIRSSGLGV